MGRLKRLLLVAAALAVAGFVVVAAGQGSSDADEAEPFGWYAYPPSDTDTETTNDEASTVYSSSLQTTLDDEPRFGAVTLVGFGLVGLSFLMTAGIVGTWAARKPE